MKLILATSLPFLAKFHAFSIPAAQPDVFQEIMLQELNELNNSPSTDCSNVWNKVCTGTNSNGDRIYGSWTCGERVQYVHDYKLGRSPSLSAAIDQILSECPTQCQELADNQCDAFAQTNLKVPDCSTTWNKVCSGVNSARQRIYGSFTCGARVLYVHNVRPRTQNLERAVNSVYYQCRDQCKNINNAQCVDFVEGKLNAVNDDDYETIASVQATTRPLGTCQEAFDRTCTEGWGSYTCGARVNYVYTQKLGNNPLLTDAINKVNGECPTQCSEFQNGNCDDFIEDQIVVENGSGSN